MANMPIESKRKHWKWKRSHYITLHKQSSSDICVYLYLEGLPCMETWRSRLCVWVLTSHGQISLLWSPGTSWKPRKLEWQIKKLLLQPRNLQKYLVIHIDEKNTHFLTLFMPVYDIKCTCFGLHFILKTFVGFGSIWRLSCYCISSCLFALFSMESTGLCPFPENHAESKH